MRIKHGVSLEGLQPPMHFALGFLEALFISHNLFLGPCITSTKDSHQSKPQSLHHKGLAVDIRTKDILSQTVQEIYRQCKYHLDRCGFDTVLESDHLHIEYDPKPGEYLWQK